MITYKMSLYLLAVYIHEYLYIYIVYLCVLFFLQKTVRKVGRVTGREPRFVETDYISLIPWGEVGQ